MATTLRLLIVCAIVGAAATTLRAQEFPCWNSTAYPIDTLTLQDTTLGPGQTFLERVSNGDRTTWDVFVFMTSGGSRSLYIPVESVGFSGNGVDSVDNRSTGEIFTRISLVTVQRALLGGVISPPAPGTTSYITVTEIGCVERSGYGSETSFAACTYPGGCCRREYAVTTPPGGGMPFITFLSSNGPNCTGECESTCDDGKGLLSRAEY